MTNQLIIIGNGFDLHCHLNTKFTDYFETTQPSKNDYLVNDFFDSTSYNHNKIYNTHPYFKALSFWDIYFNSLKSNNIEDWADVEKKITIFLKCEDTQYNNQISLKLVSLSFIYCYFYYKNRLSVSERSIYNQIANELKNKTDFLPLKLGQYIYREVQIISDGKYEKELNSFKRSLNNYLIPTSVVSINDIFDIGKELIYTFLIDELHVFERNLKNYIKNQFDNKDHNFEEITKYTHEYDQNITKMSNNQPYNLISFNYTKPLHYETETNIQLHNSHVQNKIKNTKPLKCQEMINIHGSLNKNIILGIDENGINESDILYKFTKTYRLLELDNAESSCLNKSIKHIKFYGHSLAAADYSYFQSIFDFYDIYNSDIDLTFYYSNFDDNEKNITINRVVNLIKTYGKTLNNKDHGKNLLHKLKLENRLLIKEL